MGGALIISDVNSTESGCESVCREKKITAKRNITESQSLLYQNNGSDSLVSYDLVTEFGLHPVEFLQVFRLLGKYFHWFYVNKEPMLKADMVECLDVEIARCFLGGLPQPSGKATLRGFSRGQDACSIHGWSRSITSSLTRNWCYD